MRQHLLLSNGHWVSKGLTRHIRVTIQTRVTRPSMVTRPTRQSRVTRKTRVTRQIRVTRLTRLTRLTRMIRLTRLGGARTVKNAKLPISSFDQWVSHCEYQSVWLTVISARDASASETGKCGKSEGVQSAEWHKMWRRLAPQICHSTSWGSGF